MNDARKRPAAQNPWHVLATLAGEPSTLLDYDLHKKNRAYWNAWASQGMTQAQKNAVQDAYGKGVLEDAPAWETVQAEVESLFKKRLPAVALPDPSAAVDFSNVAFLNPVRFAGFFFAADADFTGAAFSGEAYFRRATFSGEASFRNATFSVGGYFRSAAFSGEAYFTTAAFSGTADFDSARFSEGASFASTVFSERAVFDSAAFSERAGFNSAVFSGRADFRRATFSGEAYFTTAAFSGVLDFDTARFSGNATFGSAVFSERADFYRATFSGYTDFDNAAFSGARLRYANLQGAFLEDADVRTFQVGGAMRPTDLSTCIGLTQAQLAKMKGDSGTLLPEGLEHPDHWPKLDAPLSEAIDEPSPFVFLSYAHADHARAALVVGFLKRHGFTVWWDDTLNSGDKWREVIAQKLNQASAVFTLWTDSSVASNSVTEEASGAQSADKLVHAKLDACQLPYGFGGTQYGTLIGWDCFSDTPQALRIVAALRAKIAPPSAADQSDRLTRASDVDFAAYNGKMTMGDRPLGVPPPVVDPDDLEKRIAAQSFLIDEIKRWVEEENPNLNQKALLTLLNRYDRVLRHSSVNWYRANGAVKALNNLMGKFRSEVQHRRRI
jgi:uncharacterized protein YjbI with pentapeptide repeats